METGGFIAIISAISVGIGSILTLLGKWILDLFQKKSDVTIAELKAKVEAQKTEREMVFNEAMELIRTVREERAETEKENAILRDSLTKCLEAKGRLEGVK